MELTAADLWSRILQVVQAAIPEHAYRAWLAGTRPGSLTDRELQIEASSEFHAQWLEDKYVALLEDAGHRVLGRPIAITFTLGDSPSLPPVPSLELVDPVSTHPVGSGSSGPGPSPGMDPGLNSRYTFERFVVGGDNQLAAAASVATLPPAE